MYLALDISFHFESCLNIFNLGFFVSHQGENERKSAEPAPVTAEQINAWKLLAKVKGEVKKGHVSAW